MWTYCSLRCDYLCRLLVKSKRGTQFRIWATGILKEYMRKGFARDDERLKNLAAVDISKSC